MKKYKLKLKNPNKTFAFYGVVSHSGENSEFNYLSNEVEGYDYRKSDSDKTIFTKEEIAILPYGLVKLHYIIEVKEQLYYIRIPHVKNQYVTYSEMNKCSYAFYSKNNDYTSKNKFTLEEAKKYYPELANDTFLVKVEELDI